MSGSVIVRLLKQATGELIHQFGPQKIAAALLDKSQQSISRFGDTNSPADVITLPDLVTLEQAATEPSVTRLLCKLNGGVFLRLPQSGSGDAPLALRVCELAKELGDVSARVSEALADGEVQPREAAAAEAEVDDLIERAVCLRAELQRLQGAGVVSIPVREGRCG